MKLYIARDKDGCLFMYDSKPIKRECTWDNDGKTFSIDDELFSEISWEDTKPAEVDLIINKK